MQARDKWVEHSQSETCGVFTKSALHSIMKTVKYYFCWLMLLLGSWKWNPWGFEPILWTKYSSIQGMEATVVLIMITLSYCCLNQGFTRWLYDSYFFLTICVQGLPFGYTVYWLETMIHSFNLCLLHWDALGPLLCFDVLSASFSCPFTCFWPLVDFLELGPILCVCTLDLKL